MFWLRGQIFVTDMSGGCKRGGWDVGGGEGEEGGGELHHLCLKSFSLAYSSSIIQIVNNFTMIHTECLSFPPALNGQSSVGWNHFEWIGPACSLGQDVWSLSSTESFLPIHDPKEKMDFFPFKLLWKFYHAFMHMFKENCSPANSNSNVLNLVLVLYSYCTSLELNYKWIVSRLHRRWSYP